MDSKWSFTILSILLIIKSSNSKALETRTDGNMFKVYAIYLGKNNRKEFLNNEIFNWKKIKRIEIHYNGATNGNNHTQVNLRLERYTFKNNDKFELDEITQLPLHFSSSNSYVVQFEKFELKEKEFNILTIEENGVSSIRIFGSFKVLPRLILLVSPGKKITCHFFRYSFSDYLDAKILFFDEVLAQKKQKFNPSERKQVLSLSYDAKFWGKYTCSLSTNRRFKNESYCLKPNYVSGFNEQDCNLQLELNDICYNNLQCKYNDCNKNICGRGSSTLTLYRCDDSKECTMYVENSICLNKFCSCESHKSMRRIGNTYKCVQISKLHQKCDSSSYCIDERSDCINGRCSCISGHHLVGQICVLKSTEPKKNYILFAGIGICIAIIFTLIILILVIKNKNTNHDNESSTRNRSSRIRRRYSRRVNRRNNFIVRTPPPSYSRVTKPPCYEEALQIEERCRRESARQSLDMSLFDQQNCQNFGATPQEERFSEERNMANDYLQEAGASTSKILVKDNRNTEDSGVEPESVDDSNIPETSSPSAGATNAKVLEDDSQTIEPESVGGSNIPETDSISASDVKEIGLPPSEANQSNSQNFEDGDIESESVGASKFSEKGGQVIVSSPLENFSATDGDCAAQRDDNCGVDISEKSGKLAANLQATTSENFPTTYCDDLKEPSKISKIFKKSKNEQDESKSDESLNNKDETFENVQIDCNKSESESEKDTNDSIEGIDYIEVINTYL